MNQPTLAVPRSVLLAQTPPTKAYWALNTLGAPSAVRTTTAAALNWAIKHLMLSVTTLSHDDTPHLRHRVLFNPVEGTSTCAQTTQPEPGVDAEMDHFFWAMAQPVPAACVTVPDLLADWVGTHYSPPQLEFLYDDAKVGAVRTVMRLGEYVNAGLDPHEHEPWFVLGATAANVAYLKTAEQGLRTDRNSLRRITSGIQSEMVRRLGDTYKPYAGNHGVPVAADFNDAVDLWMHNHAADYR